MSRPARCTWRTVALVPKGLRKGHRFTSWTSYAGWQCSGCGRPEPGNRSAPAIVAGGTYLFCQPCRAYHWPDQHIERLR